MIKEFFTEKLISFSWKKIFITAVVIFVITGILFAGLAVYAAAYEDKVLPGVYLGETPVGGMGREELKKYLDEMNDRLANEGIKINYRTDEKTESFVLQPMIATQEVTVELIRMDTDRAIDGLMAYGRDGRYLTRIFNVLKSKWQKPRLNLAGIIIEEEKIVEEVKEKLSPFEKEPRDATVKINAVEPPDYSVVPSAAGYGFQYENIPADIRREWSALNLPEINLVQSAKLPAISEAELASIEGRLSQVLKGGALTLQYVDPHTKQEYFWTLTVNDLINYLEAQKVEGSGLGFGLNKELLAEYLQDKIAERINVPARDAKFEMAEDGRVVAFQGSRPGVELDAAESFRVINDAFLQRTWHDEGVAKAVSLSAKQTEPDIKTGEVNDLGIAESLGTGISSYKGSPRNRVLNIRNAVKKLNGILIKPGEEFSALKFLAPFTLEGGYLPELVIKGDEIKPEIGGGLCQIGTTLFRMAMNSGMPITERRNHSLAVSYYNDPANNNPGTDATIYDPSPDFRFLNDTGNYLLLQAYMDEESQELYFTLWGASDGRKGYYSAPIVSRWYGIPAAVIKETTDLPVGQKKCQHAYRGADASFTYTRELPDGTKEERVFESHYRSLPEICLLGVEKKVECKDGEECPVTEESADVDTDVDTVEGEPVISDQ